MDRKAVQDVLVALRPALSLPMWRALGGEVSNVVTSARYFAP